MNKNIHIKILALQSVFLVILLAPAVALGADSTSFRLYDGISDIADPSPLGSTSYSLNEGGETWVTYPVIGSNFQIVTAPPAQSSSSSASTTSSSSSSEEAEGQGSGGHRGGRSNEGRGPTAKPSAPEEESAPRLPAQISDQPDATIDEQLIPSAPVSDPLPGVDFLPDDPTFATPKDAVGDPRFERRTQAPHFFDITTDDQLVCKCPDVHAAPTEIIRVPVPVPVVFQNPIPSMLMLMSAFGLGYLSKLFRPGHMQVASAPRSKKKKR